MNRNGTSYQSTLGTITAGQHPGSYNGQDAYNDLLIVERERERCLYVMERYGKYKESKLIRQLITFKGAQIANLIIERDD